MTGQSEFRIVDLLADQQLGLQLLTDSDPDTPVRGAHAIEIENPSRWLKPGWLMLTTGARFAGPADTGEPVRELVRELRSAGIAGLAFGVGVVLDKVPVALLDEAEKCGLPVFSVPLRVPFLQVIDFVNRATLTKDVYLLRRTVSIQDYLLESLAARDATAAVVHRLAELLRSTVVLYDESGTTVASSGVGPTQIIRGEIAQHQPQRRRFTVGRWQVLTDPIVTDNVLHWLAVASRKRSVSEDLAEPALEAARRLVNMIVRSRETIKVEDRLRRVELLRLLLGGRQSDSQYIWNRLEMHRFQRAQELRLLVLVDTAWSPAEVGYSEAEMLARAEPFEKAAIDLDLRMLVGGHSGVITGVVEAATQGLRPWLNRLAETVHCGLSEPFSDLTLAPTRFREAQLAVASARREGNSFQRFEKIGLIEWLVAGREENAVRTKARQMLAPLAENASLLDALAAYFQCDCDIQRTARSMALHPNSIRYRLKRAAELLDRDLRSPADSAELSLSIRLARE